METTLSATAEVLSKYKALWGKPYTSDVKLPSFSAEVVTNVCKRAIELLSLQSLYLELGYPLTIVGDIHGSLNDLFRILRLFKLPPIANYLFLGDYIDRGANSVDVILLLLSLFCEHPVEITLLRGNHEFAHINKAYGFHEEIMKTYQEESIWELFQEVFSYLPLVAVVNDEIFCVHGGISPHIKTIQEIKSIPMPFKGYQMFPPVADLVWSDPGVTSTPYERNFRGSGFIYGQDAIETFLKANKLKLLVRAHQCTMKGVHSFSGEMGVTIFSCSDYGSVCKNRCGVCRIGNDKRLYFYSLGTDTERAAHASAIMILNGRIGLHLPESKETPVSPPKQIVKKKKKRSETPQNHHRAGKHAQKSHPNENDDCLSNDIEFTQHPSIKFLREDSLSLPIQQPKTESSNDTSQTEEHKEIEKNTIRRSGTLDPSFSQPLIITENKKRRRHALTTEPVEIDENKSHKKKKKRRKSSPKEDDLLDDSKSTKSKKSRKIRRTKSEIYVNDIGEIEIPKMPHLGEDDEI